MSIPKKLRALLLAATVAIGSGAIGGCRATPARVAPAEDRGETPAAPVAAASQGEPAAAVAEQATEPLGSLRNARIAVTKGARPSPLVYFAGELDAAELERVAGAAPGVEVVAGLTRDAALARAGEADGVDARLVTPQFLAAAKKLAWVQAMSAGVDRYVALPGISDGRVVLTNLRGVHGPAIADHVFGMLFYLTRDLGFHLGNQARGVWGREGSGRRPIALQGRTLLVVGLGGIGTEVARRGHGFGMRVIATRKSDAAKPEFVERVSRSEELLSLLPEADVVVVCVPLTPETEGLFSRAAFAALKPGAIFVNIARGKVADTAALVEALGSGRLAGACLDVTDPEPLPAGHPLWGMANVVITPHVAADAELTDARAEALLTENLRRFGAGEPLLNVVDPAAGY